MRSLETVVAWLTRLLPSRTLLGGDIAAMRIPPSHLAALREEDAFIVSYPRSGNRWIRAMLVDIVANAAGIEVGASPAQMPIADLHHVAPGESCTPQGANRQRIFKSHNFRALADRRMVYLFRNAADALVSYYHFRLKQPQWRWRTAAIGLDRFCLGMLPGWCNHLDLALAQHGRNPQTIQFVSFELLKSAPEESLRKVTAFFGLTADEEILRRAIERNTFERNVKQLASSSPAGTGPILRKGKVGGAAEELRAETLSGIATVSTPLYERARTLASLA